MECASIAPVPPEVLALAKQESDEIALWAEVCGDSRPALMAQLTSYLDESKDSEQSIYTVALVLSTTTRWARFCRNWRSHLWNIARTKHFHMVDFVRSDGDFKEMRGKTAERDELMKRLIATMKADITLGVSASVYWHDFAEILGPHKKHRRDIPQGQEDILGHAHVFCFKVCMDLLDEMRPRFLRPYLDRKVGFIHDRTEFQNALCRAYDTVRKAKQLHWLSSIIGFDTAGDKAGCEAADLFAWESHKHMVETLRETGRPQRRSLAVLLGEPQHFFAAYMDREQLQNVWNDWKKAGLL